MTKSSSKGPTLGDEFDGRDLLRTLIDTLPDQFYIKDTEGRYVFNNTGHAKVLGVASPEEAVGKTVFDFYPKELAERYHADEQEIFRSGQPLVRKEEPSVDEEGRRRWHSTTKVPLRNGSKKIVGLVGMTRDITERKEAQEALRESEERFRSAFENAPVGVALVGLDRRYLRVNSALCEMLGYSEEELLEKTASEIIHPDDRALSAERVRQALEEGLESYVMERRYLHADGHVVWNLSSVSLIRDSQGNPSHFVCLHQDTTERKEAEEALRKSRARFQAVFENAAIGMALVDMEGRLRESNPALQQMLGYSNEELRSMTWVEVTHPDDVELDMSHFERLKADELDHYQFEKRYIRKDGRVIWGHLTGSLIHSAEGEPQFMVGMVEDVTQRKQAEEALKESEKRFRSLIQNASDVITIIEADGTIRYESPAIERVLGYRPEERIGKNAFDYLHPDDRERSKGTFAEALGNPGQVQRPVEFRLRHKDGSWHRVETTRTNLLDDPAVKGVVANSRDVTKRRQAEEKLRESEERHRAVVEQSMEGIYLFDPDDGSVLETNRAFQELLGYTSDELLGMSIYDFIAHEREDIDSNVRRDHSERRRDKGERKYRRKDGSLVDVEVSATVIPYRNEEAICCLAHDVTERKEAEEKLRKSEASLAEAQSIAHLGNWEWDVKTGEFFWSDEVFRIYGYEPKEFVPTFEKLMELAHPEDRELVRQNIDGALYEGNPYDFEHRILRPDGEERVVHRQAKVYFDEDGEPSRMIGTIHDITEQKAAEEALRESEERFRSAFEDAPVGVALVGLDGRRFRVNSALCEMLGYSEEELLGKDYLEDVHPEDREISADHLRRVLEEGGRTYTLERRYVCADERVVWNLSSVSVIRDSQGNPSHFVCLHQDITERKALEENLEHQAFHDSLTELPNRALFLDRLEHALARTRREGNPVAVLLLDLNNFKVINDSLGHDAGNVVLVEVAGRLRDSVRPGDTVGRLFGDEFAVLLEPPSSVEEAKRVAKRIQEHLEAPFDVHGQEVFVTTSIGIAFGETEEDQPKEILRHADLAMYEAKRRGRARHELYSPSMNTRAVERLDLESELRRAIEREEFEVHYQPIIDLRTGKIGSVEALARWRHPERGLVAASEFIHLTEETGLIRPIGQWVTTEACRQAREWRGRHPEKALLMSVNFSASQFSQQPDLIPEVLSDTGLDPQGLQLEITERAVMDDAEFSLGKLRRLKGLGVGLSIDDFGMGYSCLYYLKRMPLDCLKIDRTFIIGLGEDPGDEAIVSGTIGLAHALGLAVTAEGVETADQLAKLRELGCDLAQGSHLAKPLPAEEISALLASDRRW